MIHTHIHCERAFVDDLQVTSKPADGNNRWNNPALHKALHNEMSSIFGRGVVRQARAALELNKKDEHNDLYYY
jgi:hypothetical protein